MKFILLSDMHLMERNPVCRLDNIEITQFDKLSYILEYAAINGLPILQAGDFFDRPRCYKVLGSIIFYLNI